MSEAAEGSSGRIRSYFHLDADTYRIVRLAEKPGGSLPVHVLLAAGLANLGGHVAKHYGYGPAFQCDGSLPQFRLPVFTNTASHRFTFGV